MTFFNLQLHWNKPKTEMMPVQTIRSGRYPLSQSPRGLLVRVLSLSPDMPADRRAHLHAYGVIPGYCIQVTQQKPVTVIRIEHTEIALESDLADLIQVEPMD